MDYRKELEIKRESLRVEYAKFRKLAAILSQKYAVRYSRTHHEYVLTYYDRGLPYKLTNAARLLMKLQKNIAVQAMLFLELEHAIDCEEQKRDKSIDVDTN